jgi:hypothetical protein
VGLLVGVLVGLPVDFAVGLAVVKKIGRIVGILVGAVVTHDDGAIDPDEEANMLVLTFPVIFQHRLWLNFVPA